VIVGEKSLVGVMRRLLTEWAFRRIWEVEEVDIEADPRSVRVRYSLDMSLYAVTGWEGSYVGDLAGVGFGDGGVAQLACGLTKSEAGGGSDSEEKKLHDRSRRHQRICTIYRWLRELSTVERGAHRRMSRVKSGDLWGAKYHECEVFAVNLRTQRQPMKRSWSVRIDEGKQEAAFGLGNVEKFGTI
jgi:hypothetical protein